MTNDQTVTQALEPCPFCGGEGLSHRVARGWRVSCKNCDAQPRPGLPPKTEAEAIAAWNTRTAHSGEGRSNDDSPVALLHENAAEGEMEVELYRHGAACLTDADMAAGWTETPLYAHPPCEGRSNGAGEDASLESWADIREKPDAIVACGDRWKAISAKIRCGVHGFNDGKSASFVTPDGNVIEIGPKFRAVIAALSAPQGEVERVSVLEAALWSVLSYDQLLRQYAGPKAVLFAGDVATIDSTYDAMIAKVTAALAQPEAGGGHE